MSILIQAEPVVNTRYWSGSPVLTIGDTYLVIDRNTGFVTLLRHGDSTNVVGALSISVLRKALGHPLGFAMPDEQTQSQQDAIVAMAKNAANKVSFEMALSMAYEYDAMLMTSIKRVYGSKWN